MSCAAPIRYPHRSPPPFFTPARLRQRKDGWSPQVQCAFLAQLYLKGSVAAAARAVGKTRETAYRLRARPEAASFRKAWDRVLAGPAAPGEQRKRSRREEDWRKVTLADLQWRVETGLWRPVIYHGKMHAIARKPDNSALLRLLRRMDAATRRIEREAS